MSCGVGCRNGSDPVSLWLWHRSATAALIGPLAWVLPYATHAALQSQKKKKFPFKKTWKNGVQEMFAYIEMDLALHFLLTFLVSINLMPGDECLSHYYTLLQKTE